MVLHFRVAIFVFVPVDLGELVFDIGKRWLDDLRRLDVQLCVNGKGGTTLQMVWRVPVNGSLLN